MLSYGINFHIIIRLKLRAIETKTGISQWKTRVVFQFYDDLILQLISIKLKKENDDLYFSKVKSSFRS